MARVVKGGHQLRVKPVVSSKQRKITSILKRTDSREAASGSSKPSLEEESIPEAVPLLALPLELLKTIVEYIPRNTDKCNICLTCKELRELVLPYLYRHMVVGPHKLHSDQNALFNTTHKGLQHTRTLRIITDGYSNSAFYLSGLCRLLVAMPKDCLQSFDLPTTAPVHQDLAFLLRLRQRKLQNHQYHSPDLRIADLPPEADELCHITSVEFFLRKKKDCQAAGSLLERVERIQSLAIVLEDHLLDFEARDSGAAGLAVIKALFDSGNVSRSCPGLKRLRIQSMSFESIGFILPTLLTLNHLQKLQLYKCWETNRLYETLSQLRPPLHTFSDERFCNDRFQHTTDMLFKSLAPLKTLRISVDLDTPILDELGWSALMAHASQLEILEVNDWCTISNSFKGDRALPLLDAFCERASRLQQLAIECPEIASYSWKSITGLDSFLTCLRKLPKLRFLKLTVHPQSLTESDSDEDEDEDDFREEINDRRFDKESKQVADRIFERLADFCPFLVALVIDASDANPLVMPAGFLRAKQLDLYGKMTHVGVPIQPRELPYHEPCSEILCEEVSRAL